MGQGIKVLSRGSESYPRKLLWVASGCYVSQAKFASLFVRFTESATLSKSPFGNRAALAISTRGHAPEEFACGTALGDLELFSLELATAAAAISGAAAPSIAAPTAAPAPTAAATPVPQSVSQ